MGWVVIAAALAGCTVKGSATPQAPEQAGLPYDPTTIRADPAGAYQARGPFRVDLAVRATTDITAADKVTLRVVASGKPVASVPVVVDVPPAWNGEAAFKVFTAPVRLARGDYEVELVHNGRRILGHAFKLAEVPVWGGGRQVQFFWHQQTRVDLDAGWLRLARWVVEDEPTQAFVIEWWRDGKRIEVTTGRTDRWETYQTESTVRDAYPRKQAGVRRSIWVFGGERYAIPSDLVLMGGMWEARVYREGAPPVAVAFELGTGPETLESRVVSLKKSHVSAELFLRPLPEGLGVERFAAIPGKQEPTASDPTKQTLVDPIPVDRGAVRALFRSPELARKWNDFLEANSAGHYVGGVNLASEQDWNLTAQEKQLARDDRSDPGSRSKLGRLRPEIVALIKKYSGPWQPNEIPR